MTAATPKTGDELSEKQKTFAAEYLVDFNGKRAAISAGYSPHTAEQQASRLLRNVKVQKLIDDAQAARLARLERNADWVLSRLFEEADADLADIYYDDGTLKPVNEWPKIWRQGLVAGIKTSEIYEGSGEDRKKVGDAMEVKISNRIKQIELIGKHIQIGAFKDRVEVDPSDKFKIMFRDIVSGDAIRPRG